MTEFNSEIMPILIICGIYTVIFTIAELWRHFGKPAPELTRKFVHLTGGLTALSFAYVFKSHWSVLFLISLFFFIILISKKLNLLKSVHGVDRETSGGIYFPLAVYITFVASRLIGNSDYYFLSILILAVSDSLAALIGTSYGVKKYQVNEERKSIEGSVIFFLSTYIIISAGLLLLTDFGRPESILAGVYIATLVTAFEAISWKGTDNLYIPLGTIYILNKMTDTPSGEIGKQIVIMYSVLLIFYLITMPKKRVSGNALFGISLLGYGAWSLIDFPWFIPVLTGYLLFTYLGFFVEERKHHDPYQIRPVFYILGVSLIWIISGNYYYGTAEYYFTVPFLINFSANMSILWGRKIKISSDSKILNRLKNTSVFVRSLILTVIFVPVQSAFDPRLEFIYPLLIVYIVTVLSDLTYHVLSRKIKPLSRENLMIMGFILSLVFSFSAFLMNLAYYGNFLQ